MATDPKSCIVRTTNKKAKYTYIMPRKTGPNVVRNSVVWKYFTEYIAVTSSGDKFLDESNNEVILVRCGLESCKQRDLAYHSSSTKGMAGHLVAYHLQEVDQETQEKLQKFLQHGKHSAAAEDASEKKRKQRTLQKKKRKAD